MRSHLTTLRPLALALAALLLAGLSLILIPQQAQAASQLTLDATHHVGAVNRNAVVDDARQRVYVTVDPDPVNDPPGQITWFDLATGAPSGELIQLPQPEPVDAILSADGSSLYVLHNHSETLSVVDLNSPSHEVREITGVPDFPSGLIEDRDTGLVYVFDSSALYRVNPATSEVSDPISVSTERYPLVKDAVYDSSSQMIWVAEGRANVITGYSTATSAWVDAVAIPVAGFEVNGAPVGGRASALAMDETLGELHIAVLPTINDDWTKTKVLSLRVADGLYVGEPIEVGENVYDMIVNPSTHDVMTTDGFSNTVSLISPDTWTVEQAVDFTAAGVTEGTGRGYADVWGLGATADGSQVFVSHPYSERLSVLSRSGEASAPTQREVAPGQTDAPEPPEENEPWEGPVAPEPSATPDGAAASGDGTLSWAINDYMQAWAPRALGGVVHQESSYVFSDGDGWYDDETGEADLVWSDGIFIQHYPQLAPAVSTTLGNPRLQIAADGTGALTFDVAWSVSEGLQSDGYRRVTLATFADAQVTRDGDDLTLTATPDFTGRALELGGRSYPDSYPADFVEWLDPQLQPWWLTTGASMDAEKIPLPFTVTATLATSNNGGGSDSSGGSDASASSDASGSEGGADSAGDPQGAQDADASGIAGSGGSDGSEPAHSAGNDSDTTDERLSTTGSSPAPWLLASGALVILGAIVLSGQMARRRMRSERSSR